MTQEAFEVKKTKTKLMPIYEPSICGHAGIQCYPGSALRQCNIANFTSCEHFNNPDVAANCFTARNHKFYTGT